MSEKNINVNESGYGNNVTNSYVCYADNPEYSDQLQNSSSISSGMFNIPPPRVYPHIHQMSQSLMSIPPPPLPPTISGPPPQIPLQPVLHNTEIITPCLDSSYYESRNKSDFFIQPYASASIQQQLLRGESAPSPDLSLSCAPQRFLPSLKPNVTLPLSGTMLLKEGEKFTYEAKDKTEDLWVTNWVENIKKLRLGKVKETEISKGSSGLSELKIYKIREIVVSISKQLAELENSCKSLAVIYKSLSENEWTSRCVEIEEKKKSLSNLLRLLIDNEKAMLTVKQKLNKRKKKRERQKRKREEWKQEKVENSVKRQKLHQNIDSWLEDMKETVERGKRDEELKREADSVLADVTRKKAEAKKQIALLSALLKLREARVIAQRAMGRSISQPQTDAFNSVIEHLKMLWTKQLKVLSLEEQGLKVMLNEAAAEEKNNEAQRKKEILHEWEMAMFGDSINTIYQPNNINEFVSIRKQWDQFVVDEGAIMSSSIPTGWILPVKGSNSDWMKFSKAPYNI